MHWIAVNDACTMVPLRTTDVPKEGLSGRDDTEFADLPLKTLLTPHEVARFLSVSLKTVYRWYRLGAIEGTKAARSLRIYRDSVLKLIDEKDAVP